MMSIFSFIPLPYRILAAVLITAGLFFGGYFYGLHTGDAKSNAVISTYKQKQTKLSDDLSQIQLHVVTKIVTHYVTKYVHIKDVGVQNEKTIINYVPDVEFLSNGWVYAHDSAATGVYIDPTKAANDSPSTTKANQALSVVSENYTTCNATREELISLQDWIKAYNSAVVQANKNAEKNR